MLKEIDLQHPAAPDCVAYICQNLRPEDPREVATTPASPYSLEDGFLSRGEGVIVSKNSEPTALLWWLEVTEKTCFVAMLSTTAWPSVGRAITRLVLKNIIPKLRAQGIQHAYCIAEESNNSAKTWLERIGFRQSGFLPINGKNKELFHLYIYKF